LSETPYCTKICTKLQAVVNKTSLTIRVTPFPNVTSTNIETNVYATNGTFSFPIAVGKNPISLFANDAPGIAETTTVYNASQTVLAGVTLASPAAAYIYTSLKIITVAPVTNSNGEVLCGTDFSFPTTTLHNINGTISTETATSKDTAIAAFEDATYSNINSNAQAYFGGYGIIGTSTSDLAPEITTLTLTNSDTNGVPTTTITRTNTNTFEATFFINSQFESVDVSGPKPTGFTLTFDPFVYQPASGKLGKTGHGSIGCSFNTGTEGYGYPPQTLLDSLIANPSISSQYPGLASCLPAGPSLIHPSLCSAVAPEIQSAGGDLTGSTIITVTPSLPITSAQPVLQTSNTPILVSTTAPIQTPPPQTTPLPETPTSKAAPQTESLSPPAETPITTSIPPVGTPTLQIPSISLISTTVPLAGSPTIPPAESPSAAKPPASNPIPSPSQSIALPPTEPPPASNPIPFPSLSIALPPTETPPAVIPSASNVVQIPSTSPGNAVPPQQSANGAIASEIASIIGATPILRPTTISGSQVIVIASSTTIPFNPLSTIFGSTVVESGSTQIIVSSATTIPISQAIESLLGGTGIVSGTLEIVLSSGLTVPVNSNLPEIAGSTTLISGTPFVIISTPITVPLASNIPTSAAGGKPGLNATTSAVLQASVGVRNWEMKIEGIISILSIVALVCM
jgi:hypothetical protein